MGSENARIVSQYGGFLDGKSFMLLTTMAWTCFDNPGGPNGEEPRRVFMSIQTMVAKAFREHMALKPAGSTERYSEVEWAAFRSYDAGKQKFYRALRPLKKEGIVMELKKGATNQAALYELNLDRLQELGLAHFEQSAVSETLSDGNRHSSQEPTKPLSDDKHHSQVTEIVTEKSRKRRKASLVSDGNRPHKNNVTNNSSMNTRDETTSSQATKLRGVEPDFEEAEELPVTLEEQRNRMMAALREAHPEEFQPTGTDDGLW